MGPEVSPGVFKKEAGSLFSVNTDYSVKQQVDKCGISNGLAWSADNKTMYFVDSVPRLVYAFDCDIATGLLSTSQPA